MGNEIYLRILMDLPVPLNDNQIDFIIEQLARNNLNLLEVKNSFERFYGKQIPGETIQVIKENCKDQIAEKRRDIYENGIYDIPLSHAYTIIAIAQSRLEYLAKNPKTTRQNRRIDENTGKEYYEDEKEIDDKAMQDWIKIAQNERFFNIKMEMERIVKTVDKQRIPKTSFKPAVVETGFSVDEEEQANS